MMSNQTVYLCSNLSLLTADLKLKLCTEVSHPSIILCSTRVVTIAQSVEEWTYSQDFVIVTECVTNGSRKCLVSFLPCHSFDVISGIAVCDVTGQCHWASFCWHPGTSVSHSCTWRVCSIQYKTSDLPQSYITSITIVNLILKTPKCFG